MDSQKFIGSSFEELSQEEMDFVTGANGGTNSDALSVQTITTTATISTAVCASAITVSVVSAIVASRATDCM